MSQETQEKPLVVRFAERFGVDETKLLATLKATAFKQKEGVHISNEQMMALLVVADQYNLNPFTREIYAFPDKNNGIVPVVGVDGWNRIANDHPKYDGIEFVYAEKMVQMEGSFVECPEWIECVIYRSDRSRPTRAREYLDECYKKPYKGTGQRGAYTVNGPWQTHTKRMLRTKAQIQCSRMTFGFGGIYDQDEADNFRDLKVINPDDASILAPLPVTAVESPAAPVSVNDDPKLLSLLDKLVARAKNTDAWNLSHQYIEERFQKSPEILTAAKQYLLDAQLEMDGDSTSASANSDNVNEQIIGDLITQKMADSDTVN